MHKLHDAARASRAAKMRAMGVTPGPDDRARARTIAGNLAPTKQGDPENAMFLGQKFPADPAARAKQFYAPKDGPTIPLPAWSTRDKES